MKINSNGLLEIAEKLFKKIKVKTLVDKVIPKLNQNKIKGQNGVVGVIGGSFEYCGAPYYSAVSALKSGVDLSHVFCHVDAAIPIKSYSPELIVHPGFDNNIENKELLKKTCRWFKSMDVLVYGPGMGREEPTPLIFDLLLTESMKLREIIHILDADALWHFIHSKNYEMYVNEIPFFIVTPNITEYGRMHKMFFGQDINDNQNNFTLDDLLSIIKLEEDQIILFDDLNKLELDNPQVFNLFKKEIQLTIFLKNKILVKKGKVDIITDGSAIYLVSNRGSQKRCGGLGDILGGVISAFCAMVKKEFDKSYEIEINNKTIMEAIALASYICRLSSEHAYSKHGYSLTAPDVINELSKIAKDYEIPLQI